jgi:hypothetical protein
MVAGWRFSLAMPAPARQRSVAVGSSLRACEEISILFSNLSLRGGSIFFTRSFAGMTARDSDAYG